MKKIIIYIKNTPIQSPGLALFPFLDCMLLDEGQGGKVLILGDPHSRSLGVPI